MCKTKIVATIGPASAKAEVLEQMIDAGMHVARINFSHGTHEEKREAYDLVRAAAEKKGKNVALLADLQGPKIRMGDIQGDTREFLTDEEIIFSVSGENESIPVPHPDFINSLQIGDRLIVGDGEIQFEVVSKEGERVVAKSKTRGVLVSRRGLHSTGSTSSVSSITKKDIEDLDLVCELGFDYVAQSFVRSVEDIIELRTLLKERGAAIPIIAKIEKRQAIDVLEDIVKAVDAVMVARGDLAIDTSTQEVPIFQKKIIKECLAQGKPVITATQMLQSMIENSTPTRAEASDVANAILDGTDAVMLSNETAVGKYPVESVQTMHDISDNIEAEFSHDRFGDSGKLADEEKNSTSNAISVAAYSVAKQIGATAIITMTSSGYTALRTARLRPNMNLYALTPNEATHKRLALVWGVTSYLVADAQTADSVFESAHELAQFLPLKAGDKAVITAGIPFGQSGTTNLIRVYEF